MDDLTERARRFAHASHHYTGGEVQLWVCDLCDRIDALRAQVAALEAENEALTERSNLYLGMCREAQDLGLMYAERMREAEAERDAARAEAEALRADAERPSVITDHMHAKGMTGWCMTPPDAAVSELVTNILREALTNDHDAAIDAAQAKGGSDAG